MPNSGIIKRSVRLEGVRTSVSLEEVFWIGLKEIALQRHKTIGEIISEIVASKDSDNLSSAIRVFVFEQVRRRGGGRKKSSQATTQVRNGFRF